MGGGDFKAPLQVFALTLDFLLAILTFLMTTLDAQ